MKEGNLTQSMPCTEGIRDKDRPSGFEEICNGSAGGASDWKEDGGGVDALVKHSRAGGWRVADVQRGHIH